MPKKQAKSKAPKKKGKKGGKRPGAGRPLVEVDEKIVVALAAVGCTVDEVASYVGCSKSVLYDRFSDVLEKGHNQQKVTIRRQQHAIMMTGDRGMAIWLGKQHCAQFEPHRITTMGEDQPRVAGVVPADFEIATVKMIFAEITKRKIARVRQEIGPTSTTLENRTQYGKP